MSHISHGLRVVLVVVMVVVVVLLEDMTLFLLLFTEKVGSWSYAALVLLFAALFVLEDLGSAQRSTCKQWLQSLQ